MNKFKRSLFDQRVAVLMALLVLYMSFAEPATAQSSGAAQQTNLHYSGETVFRGVFLDDGPVAKLFPEIWENPKIVGYRDQALQAGSEEQAATGRQFVIDGLRAQDSTFFDRFGKEMQSGDRIRIQKAMLESGDRLRKLLDSFVSDSHGRDISVDVETQLQIYKYVWFWLAVAVYVAVAVAGYVYLTLVVVFPYCAAPSCYADKPGLQQDLMIDLVATRLGPQAVPHQ